VVAQVASILCAASSLLARPGASLKSMGALERRWPDPLEADFRDRASAPPVSEATGWLWTYNHERPNMRFGGITPMQQLAVGSCLSAPLPLLTLHSEFLPMIAVTIPARSAKKDVNS
jgi:hypothetical protein